MIMQYLEHKVTYGCISVSGGGSTSGSSVSSGIISCGVAAAIRLAKQTYIITLRYHPNISNPYIKIVIIFITSPKMFHFRHIQISFANTKANLWQTLVKIYIH